MKISVIIPVYKVEKYIERCIESILSQTFQDFEIIVVDDCSPDASMDIVRKYAATDTRIKLYSHPENMGSMLARRTGYMNAQGDFFVFCDSDDWLQENSLETLHNAIKTASADIVISNMQSVNHLGNLISKSDYSLPYGSDSTGVYKALLNYKIAQSLCAKIFKRELFVNQEHATYKNLSNGEDLMLFLSVVKYSKNTVVIRDVTYNYYYNIESLSHVRLSKQQVENLVNVNCFMRTFLKSYPTISIDVNKYCLQSLINLKRQGYKKHEIIGYIKNNSSYNYFNLNNIIHSYNGLLLFKNLLIYLFPCRFINAIKKCL